MNAHAPLPVPLLVTADVDLAEQLHRLAAGAGLRLDHAADLDQVLASWSAAPAVLVGADLAPALASRGVPRRDAVHVIASGEAPDATFRAALGLGAASVAELPAGLSGVCDLLADLADLAEDDVRRGSVVGVVGGSGGVGASTLAAVLAGLAASQGGAVLLDLDPLGPGPCHLFEVDHPTGVTWADLRETRGRIGARSLRESLGGGPGAGLLTWGHDELPQSAPHGEQPTPPCRSLPPEVVREVVTAARRGHRVVVLDLPRSSQDALIAAAALCDQVVLVARPTVPGAHATARLLPALREGARSIGLAVRARRGAPVAGDLAEALRLPLWVEVPDHRRLDEHLDLGLGVLHDSRSALVSAGKVLVDRWLA